MPDADRPSRRRVLHVVEVADPFSEKLETLLAPGGAERVVVSDVYGALAQLVRPTHVRFDAVVVCLAGLDPSEMEFFSLLPRGARAAPVFVYSADGDAAKAAQAQAAGATAIGEPAPILIAIEAAEPFAPIEPETEPAPAPTVTPPPEPVAAAKMPAPAIAVPAPVEPEAPPPVDEAAPAEEAAPVEEVPAVPAPVTPPPDRVPVPWAPAANRPKRRAPAAFGPPREPVVPGSADARPLLTDEELKALLGPGRNESTPLDAEPQS